MTLTVDLQNQGKVDYCTTFFIFGCIYDIDWIYVSILLCSTNICHLTSIVDLENQGQTYL